MAYQDASASLNGILNASVNIQVKLNASLISTVTPSMFINNEVSFYGLLDSTVTPSMFINNEVSFYGLLDSAVTSEEINGMRVEFNASLSSTVVPSIFINNEASFSGSLSADINEVQVLVNLDVIFMLGVLTSSVTNEYFCPDIKIDMQYQEIKLEGCSMNKENIDITRYRGDTYPLLVTLSRNGNYDVTGIGLKMSTKLDGGTLYTFDGIVKDAINGIVQFDLPAEAVQTSGEGYYDIQGNDGTYIFTYIKGKFTLLDDVTP